VRARSNTPCLCCHCRSGLENGWAAGLLKQQNQPLCPSFCPQARCHHPVQLVGMAGAGSLEKGSLRTTAATWGFTSWPASCLPSRAPDPQPPPRSLFQSAGSFSSDLCCVPPRGGWSRTLPLCPPLTASPAVILGCIQAASSEGEGGLSPPPLGSP